MSAQCPICGDRGTIASDCPYCRDSDSFEHNDLHDKNCPSCGSKGYVEEACPSCSGRGLAGHFLKVS